MKIDAVSEGLDGGDNSRRQRGPGHHLEIVEAALVEALEPPSCRGVFWNWDALAASADKRDIVKRVCAGRRPI